MGMSQQNVREKQKKERLHKTDKASIHNRIKELTVEKMGSWTACIKSKPSTLGTENE